VNPDEPGLVFTAAVVETPPKVVQCPPAKYPATLRETKVHGQVVIELIVDTLGHPEPRSLRTVTSPHDSLSITAQAAVLGCEFTPGRVRGRPVRVLTQVPVDFDLKE
jgi:TonB family protein